MAQYIALVALQMMNSAGVRTSVEPRSDKQSGLFEHEFSAKEKARLLQAGAIRLPEGTEVHEDPTKIEELFDSRVDANANKTAADTAADNAAAAGAADADNAAADDTAAADKPAGTKSAGAKKAGSGDAGDDLLNS